MCSIVIYEEAVAAAIAFVGDSTICRALVIFEAIGIPTDAIWIVIRVSKKISGSSII